MKSFEFSEQIARPPQQVFEVIADPTRATAFLDNITECIKLTDGPIAVGTRFRETRVMGGKEASTELLVTDHEPYTHVGVSSEAEGIKVVYHYRLAPAGGGTRLTWTCEVDAGGLRRMMLPLLAGIMKKEDGEHLQRLKAHLESV